MVGVRRNQVMSEPQVSSMFPWTRYSSHQDYPAIRLVDDTIEAIHNVIRATEIVKQTLGEGIVLNAEKPAAKNDFGESRTARDGAETRSSIRLLLAAGGGILAVSVVLGFILMGIRPVSKLEHVSAGLNRGFPNVCGFGRLMALIRDEGAIDAETMFSGFARARAGSGGSGSVAARGGGIL